MVVCGISKHVCDVERTLQKFVIFLCRGICSVESDKYRDRLDTYFEPLAKSYLQICKKQYPKEFFGLRDFYRFVILCVMVYLSGVYMQFN